MPVLMSLSEDMDSDLARDMIEYRDDEKNDLTSKNWYKSVSGMAGISFDDIAVSSTHFEIQSIGSKGSMKKVIQAIVERDTGKLHIRYWKVE